MTDPMKPENNESPTSELSKSAVIPNSITKKGLQTRQTAVEPKQSTEKSAMSKEIGGQAGPEPTRFGDWEKNGRCTDF